MHTSWKMVCAETDAISGIRASAESMASVELDETKRPDTKSSEKARRRKETGDETGRDVQPTRAVAFCTWPGGTPGCVVSAAVATAKNVPLQLRDAT